MLVFVSVQQTVHMTGGGYGWYGFPRLAAHRYKTTLYWRPHRSTLTPCHSTTDGKLPCRRSWCVACFHTCISQLTSSPWQPAVYVHSSHSRAALI